MQTDQRLIARVWLTLAIFTGICIAVAADAPHRKPGLWEITHQSSASRADFSRRICLDAQTEELFNRQGAASSTETCSKVETRSTSTEFITTATCTLGSVKMTSRAVTTFTGDQATITKVHTLYDPPFDGRGESDSEEQGRWLGACPTDMKAGDMILKTGGAHPHEMRTSLSQLFKTGR